MPFSSGQKLPLLRHVLALGCKDMSQRSKTNSGIFAVSMKSTQTASQKQLRKLDARCITRLKTDIFQLA
jgi:hypothetical protein